MKKGKINKTMTKLSKKEQIKLAKQIVFISKIIERSKQRNIKMILKRLNQMSPNDVSTLCRIIKAF